MAFAHHDARPDHLRIQPVLDQLAERFGETAHFAVLDGHAIVYRAKVDPPTGAVRLTSTVGGRNPAHATAVGKLLLSYELRSLEEVRCWIGSDEPERRTERTLCSAEDLHRELARIRRTGYAVDDQENEDGVNCLAVPVFLASTTVPSGGVSVSALTYRTPLGVLVDAVDDIRAVTPGASVKETTR
jgi:DNA-binding IclR family transcriptional regulator